MVLEFKFVNGRCQILWRHRSCSAKRARLQRWRQSQHDRSQHNHITTSSRRFIIYDYLIPDSTYNVWIGIIMSNAQRIIDETNLIVHTKYSLTGSELDSLRAGLHKPVSATQCNFSVNVQYDWTFNVNEIAVSVKSSWL